MRLFKASKNQKADIERIVGEIINISFCTKYYENGKLLEHPIAKYITYIVEGTKYTILPNLVTVFLNGGIQPNEIKRVFNDVYNSMLEPILKQNPKLKFPLGTVGSTHFMMIEKEEGVFEYPNITLIDSVFPVTDTAGKVYCCFHSSPELITISDLPNHEAGKPVCEPESIPFTSTVGIIYDANNTYNLPDGYFDINYPASTAYRRVQEGKLLKEVVHFDIFHGLHEQVAIMDGVRKIKANAGKEDQRVILHQDYPRQGFPLYYLNWKDVRPWQLNNKAISAWDLLKTDFLTIEQDWSVAKETQKDWRCAVTGVRLFEDIYVASVHEQLIEKTIDRSELHNYPFGTIIETSPGSSQNKKTVTIQYIVEFNEPRHLLLSPYFVHCSGYENPLAYLQNQTKMKFTMYRSFCPTLLYTIIEESNYSPEFKKLLHELNTKSNAYNSRRGVITQSYLVFDAIKVSDFLEEGNQKSVLAIMSPGAHK